MIFSFRFSILCTIVVFALNVSAQVKKEHFEMRGVWVATVANIDWPSKAGLPTHQQKKEALNILDDIKSLGLNTVFLQVRASSDAIYPSDIEPWSSSLTGIAGQAPEPFYDPLKFWIDEAHLRGLQLHAWINPYRAQMNCTQPLPENHPANLHPEWFIQYANKLYFNPALEASKEHIIKVTQNIILNYQVDGIHMDDYFYPYPKAGEDFNDSINYNNYLLGNDSISRADWRRENVNKTIRDISDMIKQSNPEIAFGVSPFGVWRNISDDPQGSNSQAGVTNYDHLYADVTKWMKEGWIDYAIPQLYWHTEHPTVDFNTLANWWNDNSYGIPIYIGHALYKIGSEKAQWQNKTELPLQITSSRKLNNVKGNVFYSYKHFKRDLYQLQDTLKQSLYKEPKLAPYHYHESGKNTNTIYHVKANRRKAKWENRSSKENNIFIIYLKNTISNQTILYKTTGMNKIKLNKISKKRREKYALQVSSIDKYGRESELSTPIIFKL